MKPLLVGWSEFYDLCENLTEQVVRAFQESRSHAELVFYGVQRGGGIVANVMSYLAENRFGVDVYMDTVGVRRYSKETREPISEWWNRDDIVYHQPSSKVDRDTFSVIVDDIATTGITISQVRRVLDDSPGVKVATLFTADPSLVDFYGRWVPGGTWVFFPWDEWSEVDEGGGDHEARLSEVPPREGEAEEARGRVQ